MSERALLLKCIVSFYVIAVVVFTADLGFCEVRRPNTCDSPRGRLEGALTTAPASLLALLVDASKR